MTNNQPSDAFSLCVKISQTDILISTFEGSNVAFVLFINSILRFSCLLVQFYRILGTMKVNVYKIDFKRANNRKSLRFIIQQ